MTGAEPTTLDQQHMASTYYRHGQRNRHCSHITKHTRASARAHTHTHTHTHTHLHTVCGAPTHTTSSHLCELHARLLPCKPCVLNEERVLAMNGQEVLRLHKPQHLLQLTLCCMCDVCVCVCVTCV
jgi:hypothetical protein